MIRIQHLPPDVVQLSGLAVQALSGGLRLPTMPVPRKLEALGRPVDRMDERERRALAAKLESRLAPLAPHVHVLDAVRSLSHPGACAVITGQQPGFLCSPLYSAYKALQAIRLARMLSEAWDGPVAAIFWNHADDHDIAEVHHAHLLNANLDLQKIALPGFSSGRQPLSRLVFDDELHRLPAIRATLAQIVVDQPHAARALELFMPRSGETFASAFTRGFTDLFGSLGLIVLEPDWIREELSRALATCVRSDPQPLLARGAERMRALGHQVAIDPADAALVYRLETQGRRALRAGGEGFQYDGETGSRTPAELAAEIVQDLSGWSPGALLRPVVQDLCLPTAAYVGGFGEMSYLATLGDLREAVAAPFTPFVPRISCTLVDPECRVALSKLETDVRGVLAARGTFTVEPSADAKPPVLDEMRAVADRAARELMRAQESLIALDRSLESPLRRTSEQIRSIVDKLVEKAEKVHQNASGKGRRHERRVNNALYPRALPQERVLGPLPFVARFGEDWMHELCAELDPFAAEHLVVDLDASSDAGETA